jgi:hypothetical protein
MGSSRMIGALIVVLCSLPAGTLSAQSRPRGLYAKIDITAELNSHTSKTPKEFEKYLNGIFEDMLDNPAVSGLAIESHWSQLEPNAPPPPFELHPPSPYVWTYLDDAVAAVSAYNLANSTQAPKTIQFMIMPGFDSPTWVLDELSSCDGLFEIDHLPPPSDCGRVTFTGYKEGGDGNQLPLPWSDTYKTAFRALLVDVSARYGAGTNSGVISISVAGPTAASDEMIMPNDINTPTQSFSGRGVTNKISPNDMWVALQVNHYVGMAAYQNSDQAFIDEWNNAIDMYGEVFSGLTLTVATGNGFPELDPANIGTVPSSFEGDCPVVSMDCVAETTILSHFVESTVGGSNRKATQTSGVTAARAENEELGLAGVKLLAANTQTETSASTQIMAGAQFNSAVSKNRVADGSEPGSDPSFPNPSVDQAFYNVLQVIFVNTPAGGEYCQPTSAPPTPSAPLNYVQIYSNDFLYAANNSTTKVPVREGACHGTVKVSAQEELNTASAFLIFISEPEFTGF